MARPRQFRCVCMAVGNPSPSITDHVDFSRLLDTAVGGTCGQVLSVAAELYGVRRSGMMALFDEDTHSYME